MEGTKIIEYRADVDTKITIGGLTLWTRPWGEKKAMIISTDVRMNCYLYRIHKKDPEYLEILQDDEDICPEDLEGAFSLIVDPEAVQIIIYPGLGEVGIGVERAVEETKVPAE